MTEMLIGNVYFFFTVQAGPASVNYNTFMPSPPVPLSLPDLEIWERGTGGEGIRNGRIKI